MKLHLCSAVIAGLVVLAAHNTWAGAMAGGGSRDTALYANSIDRWSVGLDFDTAKRNIENGEMTLLDMRSASFFLGVDLTRWLTLFGTAGTAELQHEGSSGYGNNNFKWSGGLQANLWRVDVVDPEFMAGTLMFKSVIEYGKYKFDGTDYQNKPEWTEMYAALPICYEMYSEREDALSHIPYSLALSIGPAASMIDGTTRGNIDFSEKSTIGVMGAADIYLAHNLSFGFHVEYFDEASMGGNVIYHF